MALPLSYCPEEALSVPWKEGQEQRKGVTREDSGEQAYTSPDLMPRGRKMQKGVERGPKREFASLLMER